MKRAALTLPLLALLATPVGGTELNRLEPESSRVAFEYSQMGVTMQGAFRSVSGALRFDPARPATAEVALEVDLASIDTGLPELDAEAVTPQWFDVAAHPVARFRSTGVEVLSEGRYTVSGQLSIKGRTREVSVPATFSALEGAGVFTGTLAIRRGDYSVGEGAWADFGLVANEITIRFQITAASD